MQGGDLEAATRERVVVVIEGVLCNVKVNETKRRFRPSIVGYHIAWYETPLKRVVFIKEQYPQFALEAVTFLDNDFLDEASSFLNDSYIPFDSVTRVDFDRFTYGLRFQDDLRAIYDSDPARLERYGQLGVAVVAGRDF